VSRRLAIKAEAQGGRKTWREENESDVEETGDVVVAPRKRSRAQVKQEEQQVVRFRRPHHAPLLLPLLMIVGDLSERTPAHVGRAARGRGGGSHD
jgi:hypothetical protein